MVSKARLIAHRSSATAAVAQLCAACVQALHPLLVMTVDPGAASPNFMYATTVQTNAALGLLRLCTDPASSGAAIVSHAPDSAGAYPA